jgi:arylsulfatase A-like enzyme
VTTTALTPTILDVVGISPDAMPYSFPALRAPWEGSPGDSTDLPILVGSKIYGEPEIGLYFEHYKYVQATRRPHELLFDLASDPFEHLSLAASLPEVTERARALVRSIGQQRARKQPLSPDAPIRVDEETRKRLRSIGYLGSSRE